MGVQLDQTAIFPDRQQRAQLVEELRITGRRPAVGIQHTEIESRFQFAIARGVRASLQQHGQRPAAVCTLRLINIQIPALHQCQPLDLPASAGAHR